MVTTRETPTVANFGPSIGENEYAVDVAAHVAALWAAAPLLLSGVAGTDTVTASVTPALLAYTGGNSFWFVPVNTNTGAMTININGLGAKDLRRQSGNPLTVGQIVAGTAYKIVYDGTLFRVQDGTLDFDLSILNPPDPDGFLELIANGSLTSGTSANIVDIPAIYRYLILRVNGVTPSANNAGAPKVQFSINNGSSFANTLYRSDHYSSSTATYSSVSGAAQAIPDYFATHSTTRALMMTIFGYQSGPETNYIFHTGVNTNFAGSTDRMTGSGMWYGSTSAIDAIRLSLVTQTFTAGTYELYGAY